ncbi:acyl-CoA N-acyltransferase [Xylariales sp. AK1849]|nr:acyl-CoA N-acyltransferase [Xylariales sp. AK1849]
MAVTYLSSQVCISLRGFLLQESVQKEALPNSMANFVATSSLSTAYPAYPSLPSLTKEQLQRLYVKNEAELTRHVSAAAGAESKYFGGDDWFLHWHEVPEGGEIHNGLKHQDLPDGHVPDAVKAIMHSFGNHQFSWVTGPQEQTRLEHFLRQNDFTVDEKEHVMAADITQLPELSKLHITSPPNEVIIEAVDESSIRDWVEAWAFHAPEADIAHWTGIYTSLLVSLHPKQFRMFIAKNHEAGCTTVGTGYVHCFAGVAAIHAIVVGPEFRNQGIGRALTSYALRQASSLGYEVAVLTASTLGINFFRSLGFHEFGIVKLNVWRPVADQGRLQDWKDMVEESERDGWCLV